MSLFPSFQSSSTCDFGTVPAINVAETSQMPPSVQRFGFYMVNPRTPLITASLAIEVEDVSLFYVALDGDIEVVSYACRVI